MAIETPIPTQVSSSLALAVISSSRVPLLLLDADLRIVAASVSFCQAFEIAAEGAPGHSLPELGVGEWGAFQLQALLTATASGQAEIDAYEMDLVREGKDLRCLVLSAHKLDYDDGGNTRVVLAVADVTEARAGDKLRDELVQDKIVLLGEMKHRVANSLQIVASVLLQSARKVQSEEIKAHLNDARLRVMSVAKLQEHLTASKIGEVSLRPYIISLCGSIGASMIHDQKLLSLEVRVDDTACSADMSISLGLIITELVINALKHAFPGRRPGKIFVDYRAHGFEWSLSVRDNGVGMPPDPPGISAGLGTSIVEALARQLKASVRAGSANPGTEVVVEHAQFGQRLARVHAV